MGWLPVILLVLAIAAALYPFARKDKGALQFLAAALLLALAGYSWQGRPGQRQRQRAIGGIEWRPNLVRHNRRRKRR